MTKKEKLLITAKKLFGERGYFDTPTALIAKEAGVSNGILFHIFESKEKLILAVYKQIKEALFEYTQQQIYKAATLKESVYTLWLATVEFHLEHRDDFLFVMQFESSPFYQNQAQESNRYSQLLDELMQKGIENQLFKALPTPYLCELVNAQIHVAVHYLHRYGQKELKADYKNQLFEAVWDALLKSK